jgi:hypothetical protein
MSPLLSPASEESITAESIGTRIRALVLEPPSTFLFGYIKRIVETLTDVIVPVPARKIQSRDTRGCSVAPSLATAEIGMSPVRCVSRAKPEARAEIEPCQRAGLF